MFVSLTKFLISVMSIFRLFRQFTADKHEPVKRVGIITDHLINIINTINLNTFEYNSSMYNASHNISVDPGFTFDNFLHKYKYTKYINNIKDTEKALLQISDGLTSKIGTVQVSRI